MIEITLWFLMATSTSYGGYVTKLDEFLTAEACKEAANQMYEWPKSGPLRCVQMKVARPKSFAAQAKQGGRDA